ncbi:MAG: alpha/beta hydrolase family protein [Caulobacteraceae bacterium]
MIVKLVLSAMLAAAALVTAGLAGAEPSALAPAAHSAPIKAERLIGDWDGTLHVGGAVTLRLALHVRGGPHGLVSSLDSIDQAVIGIPVEGPTIGPGGQVAFAIPKIGASFLGSFAGDGRSLSGTFRQGRDFPIVFTRRAAGQAQARLIRPQEDLGKVPYRALEVSFVSPDAHAALAGILTEPEGAGPFPAAVLIAGSGPENRNEEVAGHRPFLVLADRLTRAGLAVLRYDKRGIGASKGDYATATTLDFAKDAAAAVAFLRSRPEIDPSRIGLIGHSEGGLIAPIVADEDRKIAFVVLLAGPGVNGARILEAQGAAIAHANGASAAAIAKAMALDDRLFAAVEAKGTEAELKARATAILTAAAPTAPAATIAVQAAMVSSPWLRFFLTYDPVPALERLHGPVLVLSGSNDLQVPPDQNLPPIRVALAHDPEATVIEIPGLNHLFQTAKTGSPMEYSAIEETFSPKALAIITAWIARSDGPRPGT